MDRKHIGLLGFLLTTLVLPSMLMLGRPIMSSIITGACAAATYKAGRTYGVRGVFVSGGVCGVITAFTVPKLW